MISALCLMVSDGMLYFKMAQPGRKRHISAMRTTAWIRQPRESGIDSAAQRARPKSVTVQGQFFRVLLYR